MIAVLAAEGGANDTAAALGSGLQATGATVVLGALGTSPQEVANVLAGAEEASGPLDAVILASAGREAMQRAEVAGLDPEQWRVRVELPLQRTLACFQGSHRRLAVRGGCLVVIVPTLALVGASGYVAWTAVAEGQRSLAKAAARAWGRQKITVNCVAVPAALLSASAGDATSGGDTNGAMAGVDPDRPGQPLRALAAAPDLRGAVATVVASLVSGGWAAVTGATIAVDGGVAMTP